MSESVGLVGMGLMGQAFSKNLLDAGFKVQGYDVDEKRMRELDRKSTRLNSSHIPLSRMPSSA